MKMRTPISLSVAIIGGAILATSVPALAAVTCHSPVTKHSPVNKHSPVTEHSPPAKKVEHDDHHRGHHSPTAR
ncbi:MAG: hypothetical protein QOH29_385 [Actinomycetota bacterium]|nr:hypothetical protein [Actinomycetota bacterium]